MDNASRHGATDGVSDHLRSFISILVGGPNTEFAGMLKAVPVIHSRLQDCSSGRNAVGLALQSVIQSNSGWTA